MDEDELKELGDQLIKDFEELGRQRLFSLEDYEEFREEKPVDHRLSIGCEQIDHRDEK
jgi:hypothetical protein